MFLYIFTLMLVLSDTFLMSSVVKRPLRDACLYMGGYLAL